jgi:hypothetical protein
MPGSRRAVSARADPYRSVAASASFPLAANFAVVEQAMYQIQAALPCVRGLDWC